MRDRVAGFENVMKAALVPAWIMVIALGQASGQSETWTTKAPMPVPVSAMATGAVDGKLYVAAGFECSSGPLSDLIAYDPKRDTWQTRAPAPTPRSAATGAVVDGILYVIGGDGHPGAVSTVEAYDPKTDTWTTKAPMPTPRYHGAAGVEDGIIYVAGGIASLGATVATLEAYDPKTNTWTTKAPMPTARYGAGSGVIDGIFYVAGGARTAPGVATFGVLEAYDPKTNTWTTKSNMPTPRKSVGAAVVDGMFYVAGGFERPGGTTVEAYDPNADSWTVKPSMPTERFLLAAGVADDVLYAVGGSDRDEDTAHACLAVNEAFSPFEMVGLDIKPGDAANTINLKSGGVISVAILGSATFDPLTVDPETVTLAGARVATRGKGVPMTSASDVNHDGYPDLVLFFRTQDLQLTRSSTEAVLYGTTFSGQRIRGADSVRIVPPVLSGKPLPKKSFETRNSRPAPRRF